MPASASGAKVVGNANQREPIVNMAQLMQFAPKIRKRDGAPVAADKRVVSKSRQPTLPPTTANDSENDEESEPDENSEDNASSEDAMSLDESAKNPTIRRRKSALAPRPAVSQRHITAYNRSIAGKYKETSHGVELAEPYATKKRVRHKPRPANPQDVIWGAESENESDAVTNGRTGLKEDRRQAKQALKPNDNVTRKAKAKSTVANAAKGDSDEDWPEGFRRASASKNVPGTAEEPAHRPKSKETVAPSGNPRVVRSTEKINEKRKKGARRDQGYETQSTGDEKTVKKVRTTKEQAEASSVEPAARQLDNEDAMELEYADIEDVLPIIAQAESTAESPTHADTSNSIQEPTPLTEEEEGNQNIQERTTLTTNSAHDNHLTATEHALNSTEEHPSVLKERTRKAQGLHAKSSYHDRLTAEFVRFAQVLQGKGKGRQAEQIQGTTETAHVDAENMEGVEMIGAFSVAGNENGKREQVLAKDMMMRDGHDERPRPQKKKTGAVVTRRKGIAAVIKKPAKKPIN